jgi:hypothetical protein
MVRSLEGNFQIGRPLIEANIGQFAFQQASGADYGLIAFAFHPINDKQSREIIHQFFAFWAQRLDSENASSFRRASHRKTTAQITYVFHIGALRELQPLAATPVISIGECSRNRW